MITDTEARRIASEWHSGGGSPLYQFASTGTLNEEVRDEVRKLINYDITDYHHVPRDLAAFSLYMMTRADRGPQEGWSKLSW